VSVEFDKVDKQVNSEEEKGKIKEVKKLTVNPLVNVYLSTVDTLINKHSVYDPGMFIKRLINRFNLIDDFWHDAIACCQYNPSIRRITIRINPYKLWFYILRPLCIGKLKNEYINGIDRELNDAFHDGGWLPDRFSRWIDLLTSKEIITSDRYQQTSLVRCFMSVIVHEVMHCAWNHLSKDRKAKEHKIANIAQDFAINQTLDFAEFNDMFMTTLNKELLYTFYEGGAPLKDDEKIKNLYAFIGERIKNKLSVSNEIKLINIEQFDPLFLNQPFEYYYSLLIKAGQSLGNVLKKSKLKKGMKSKKAKGEKNENDDNEESSKDENNGDIDDGEDGDMYDFFQHVLGKENDGDSDEWDNMSEGEKAEAIKNALGGIGRSDNGKTQFENFNPISSEMKKVLSNDVKRTVDEMLARGEIKDISDLERLKPFNLNKSFIKAIEGLYKTDTKDWDRLLKNQIMRCLGAKTHDYTMKREARGAPGMFPGKARLKSFDLIIVMDVSGSINMEDYNRFVNEIEKIAKQIDHPHVRYIQFHSTVSLDVTVPLKQVKKIGIPETGGTNLCIPLDMLRNERNKKLVVVFTDGWVESDLNNTYDYPIVVFISASGNEGVCKSLHDRGFKVIHQDGENDWWN